MTSTKVRDEIATLKTALGEKTAELDKMTDAFAVKDGKVTLDAKLAAAYQATTRDAEGIKALIAAKSSHAGLREWLDQPETGSVGGAAAAAHAAMNGGGSLGDQFLASDQWGHFKSAGFRGRTQFDVEGASMFAGDLGGGDMQAKDVFSAMAGNLTGIQALGTHQQRPIVERLPRTQHVRDLFPAEETAAAMLYGIRETGFVNNAATVAQRRAANGTSAPVGDDTDVYGRIPRSKLTLTNETYPLATIAHIMYAHRTILEDDPRVRGLINRRMVEGVRMEEDDQILLGDGIGTNLRGLLNTPRIQKYDQPIDTDTGDPREQKSFTLRRAITRVMLAEMAATGIVLNPMDWEDTELETDEMGRLTLVTSIAIGAEQRVWRLPVVATTCMPQGDYLLGAFGMGAQLFDRRQISVDVSTENLDLFEREGVTFRATERVGLVVDRPEAFVTGKLWLPED